MRRKRVSEAVKGSLAKYLGNKETVGVNFLTVRHPIPRCIIGIVIFSKGHKRKVSQISKDLTCSQAKVWVKMLKLYTELKAFYPIIPNKQEWIMKR